MSDLGAIFHVKKAGVQYDAHAYTTHDECPNPTLKIKLNGQQAYVKLVSKGSGDVPCYVKTKGGAVFQVLTSPVKPQGNFFVVKGESNWNTFFDKWDDKTHILNIDTSIAGQATVTCDTNVTTLGGLFQDTYYFTEADFSNFNGNNVLSLQSMFNGCARLTVANFSNFKAPNVIGMDFMFYTCPKLTEVDFSSLNNSKVTTMKYMFAWCGELTKIDLSGIDTSNVTTMNRLFLSCNKLTTINGVIDMKSCHDYDNMFGNCPKLTGVKIKNPPSGFDGAGLNSSQYTIV